MNRRQWASFLILCIVVLLPVASFAASGSSLFAGPIVPENCTGDETATKCGICDLATLAQNVLNGGIYLAVVGSALLFSYAGFLYLTAGGDTGKAGRAKSIFTNVAIGLLIILSAWLIVDTFMHILVGSPDGPFPWNKLCANS